MQGAERLNGRLADIAYLYGMEDYALDKLNVLEGDISKLHEPGGRYIAAVYFNDDYGNPNMDSHWASHVIAELRVCLHKNARLEYPAGH